MQEILLSKRQIPILLSFSKNSFNSRVLYNLIIFQYLFYFIFAINSLRTTPKQQVSPTSKQLNSFSGRSAQLSSLFRRSMPTVLQIDTAFFKLNFISLVSMHLNFASVSYRKSIFNFFFTKLKKQGKISDLHCRRCGLCAVRRGSSCRCNIRGSGVLFRGN